MQYHSALSVVAAATLFAHAAFGQVRFSKLSGIASPSLQALQVRVADFDGDGFLDLTILDITAGVTVFKGDGTGQYARLANIAVFGGFDHRVGDFDGDGDNDILVVDADVQQSLRLYANNGSAGFTDVTATARLPHVPGATYARTADIDRDGDLDLVVPAGRPGYVLLENRTGIFRDVSQRISSNADVFLAHEIYDVDRDGRVDLLAAGDREIVIRLQDAAGNFGARPIRVPIATQPVTMTVGDVDKDGDADIFLGTTFGRDAFYEATGLTWRDASAARLPAVARGLTQRDARFVDIDEDGDLDLVIPKASASPTLQDRTRIYVNDGRGVFSDATLAVFGPQSTLLGDTTIDDFDGDGDGDVDLGFVESINLSTRRVTIEQNMMRHVAAPASAKIGTQFSIELYAKAGFAPAGQLSIPIIGTSASPRALPVPGLGSLRIDPRGVVVLPVISHTRVTGRTTLTLSVPNDPALVGVRVWSQALVFQNMGWRFSNVQKTTLTR